MRRAGWDRAAFGEQNESRAALGPSLQGTTVYTTYNLQLYLNWKLLNSLTTLIFQQAYNFILSVVQSMDSAHWLARKELPS